MADSVLLASASSEEIDFDTGSIVGTGAITVAAVCKFTTQHNGFPAALHAGAFSHTFGIGTDGSGNVLLESSAGGTFDTGDAIAASAWVILAISKASGSVTPRVHIYRDPNWRHADMGGAVGNSSTPTGFVVGALSAGGEAFFNGNVLIAAEWDSALSDGAVAALAGGYQAWIDAAPKEGIRVNALTGLATFTGGTMAETGHTGGTVDTGDVPAWWDDSLGGPTTYEKAGSSVSGAVLAGTSFVPQLPGPPLRLVRSGAVYR